jgi:uncharacterized protein YacL
MSLYLLAVSYLAMAAAGFAIGLLFQALGLTPTTRNITVLTATPTWNYTTVLDVIFLAVIAVLGWRFLRTGGVEMLRMMNAPPVAATHQGHDHHMHSH